MNDILVKQLEQAVAEGHSLQSYLVCKRCPDWEPLVVNGEPFMANEKDRGGRCKAMFPNVYKFNGYESTFPLVGEEDWCRPGREKMIGILQAINHVPTLPQPKEYSELGS